MSSTRNLARSIGCSDCQQWLFRSFVRSVIGHNVLPSTLPYQRRQRFSVYSRKPNILPPHERSRFPDVENEQTTKQQPSETLFEALNEPLDRDAESATNVNPPPTSTIATQSDLPWYLQIHESAQPQSSSNPDANPLSIRQQLPQLPENPPNLLQPLLEHVSVDLGFDDLTLLDLRALDPPPALGANLLMIIGTARSEKHLHVSADRLCRWLRTEYKLRPHADGLLGRNELKIQMRRKARRTKLLSSTVVGTQATGEGEIEDGIRTGWVCVNVGRVEGGDLPETTKRMQRAEGIVGFGAKIEGYSSIVVQMLTEDKRGEVDLEKLWYGILKRAQKDLDMETSLSDTTLASV